MLIGNGFQLSQINTFHLEYPLLALYHLKWHIIHQKYSQFRYVFDKHRQYSKFVASEVNFGQIWKLSELRRQYFNLIEGHVQYSKLFEVFDIGRNLFDLVLGDLDFL
jgi:ribosome biogenesis protein Tsr3